MAYTIINGLPALFFVGLASHSRTFVNMTFAVLLSIYFMLKMWWVRTCRITLTEDFLEYYSGLEGTTKIPLDELTSAAIATNYHRDTFRPADILVGAYFSLVIRGGKGEGAAEISVPVNAFSRAEVQVFLSEIKRRANAIDSSAQ